MTSDFLRCVLPLALSVVSSTGALGADPGELLVFISAFTTGEGGGIHAYRLLVDTGQLQFLQRTADAHQPFFVALSPDRKFLYATDAPGKFGGTEPERVDAFRLMGDTGQLKLLNRQSALGTATCYVAVDATGKTVLAANYTSGSVVSFPVQADGSLGEAASNIQHQGSSINPDRQEAPHAHCFVISPNNRFAYSADLGLDQVLSYRLDASQGKISPGRQPFVRTIPGAGPRHLTFHPKGRHLYVINELASSVTMYDFDPETGFLIERQTIPTLPKDFKGHNSCADVKITPDGGFLYGTNRGHHSIAAYRIGDNGRLDLLSIVPSLGDEPQNLAITPGGELLLCANLSGNNVAVFRIDRDQGSLTPVGQPISIPSPSCILIR
jgi:6-phosphogluconolactonase